MAKEKKKRVSLADPDVKLPIDEYGIIDWEQVEIPDLHIKDLSEIIEIEPIPEKNVILKSSKNEKGI